MGAEDKIGLQLAGIEFLPPDLFLDDAETILRLLEAADSGQFYPAQLPFPKLPIRQIFADPQGDHYLVVPTTGDSPVALPYITGSELGTLADMRQGGFISMDALSKFSPPKPSADGFPDPAALMGEFTTDIVKSVAEGGSVTGAMLSQLQSQLTGLALSHVPEEFRGIARQALNQGLEYGPKLLDGLMSGDLSGAIKNPLANVSMGDVSNMAVGGLADMGFSALADAWKVDDHSSTLEQVAHKYGMQALGMIKGYITQQMQSFVKDAVSGQLGKAMDNLSNGFGNSLEGLGKQFDLFFNGMSSGAILPAAHKDSKDDKVDVVITGFPTVLVEGKPISRITDLLDPSKKIILEGAATVLAGGMPVGRVTSDTAIPSDLLTGAATVLIGGPSAKISTPVAPRRTPEQQPEPKPEPDQQPEPKPKPDQQPEPEPKPDQQPEPKPDQQPEPKPDQQPEPKPTSGSSSPEISAKIDNKGISAKVTKSGEIPIYSGESGFEVGAYYEGSASGGVEIGNKAKGSAELAGGAYIKSPLEGDKMYAGTTASVKFDGKEGFSKEVKIEAGMDARYSDSETIGFSGSRNIIGGSPGASLDHTFQIDEKGNLVVKQAITVNLPGGIGISFNYKKSFPVKGTPLEGVTQEQLQQKLLKSGEAP